MLLALSLLLHSPLCFHVQIQPQPLSIWPKSKRVMITVCTLHRQLTIIHVPCWSCLFIKITTYKDSFVLCNLLILDNCYHHNYIISMSAYHTHNKYAPFLFRKQGRWVKKGTQRKHLGSLQCCFKPYPLPHCQSKLTLIPLLSAQESSPLLKHPADQSLLHL